MDKADTWSKALDRALDIILAKYPARTGLGIVLGCALSFLCRLFEPALKNITFADFSGAPWWGWLPVGVILMHAPTIVALFGQRSIGNDTIDQALDLIGRANFTQVEKRQQYRNLIDKVASNVALSGETRREIADIEARIISAQRQSTKDE